MRPARAARKRRKRRDVAWSGKPQDDGLEAAAFGGKNFFSMTVNTPEVL
jgi:hypothetical protein